MSGDLSGLAAQADGPVVALVASAGGLNAVSRVLRTLPGDLDAAVIVLIHQQPERDNLLPQVLQRSSELPVEAARDGTPLVPGRVLVAPPGRHLLITAELRTALIDSGAAPPSRPSADLLLTTLALAAGAQVIAVVLSGQGHDGATGATAVHAFGGAVVASDEASSTYFSMPGATIERDGIIDHVVTLDQIGGLVGSLVLAAER
jgi:two-component system chemotaxis response regulator CheB